jgi:hypothetical protein
MWAAPAREKIEDIHNGVFVFVTSRLAELASHVFKLLLHTFDSPSRIEQSLGEPAQLADGIRRAQGRFKLNINCHRRDSRSWPRIYLSPQTLRLRQCVLILIEPHDSRWFNEPMSRAMWVWAINQLAAQVRLFNHPNWILTRALKGSWPPVDRKIHWIVRTH